MKANILVVDDSALARRTLRQLLEEMQHTVEDAVDGAQALERFYLARHQVVILDMVMGGMYGLDVLAKMKEIDPEVRVIVVTADVQKSTAEQARAAGAKALLNKPVRREALASTLTTVLEGGQTWN